jgi:hypothetical protein
MERDATWQAMVDAAARLASLLPEAETLEVLPMRQSTGFITVTEGLCCADKWTDVFEPVRKRRYLSKTWTPIQTVEEAAEGIGIFLRERPDQAV